MVSFQVYCKKMTDIQICDQKSVEFLMEYFVVHFSRNKKRGICMKATKLI